MFLIKSIIQFDLPSIADSLWTCVLPLEWWEAVTCEGKTRIAFHVVFIIFETSLTLPSRLSCLWEAQG